MSESKERKKTEIIATSSGKGGTGKTLIAACLGYALRHAGHQVLMIDADPGTDGLSLFMLGPDGMDTLGDIGLPSTYRWILDNYQSNQERNSPHLQFDPYEINRKLDHGIIHSALISGKAIYGDIDAHTTDDVFPRLEKEDFRKVISGLFEALRSKGAFDYVLIDTRGGFSFESTTVCALADSFIVVTEPDYTNFYQDRNLIKRINEIAKGLDCQPTLRGIVVNKATHGQEKEFRLALDREFPITFKDTYPVPLDRDVIEAYRHQKIPLVEAKGSEFAASTMKAFSRMMHLVTSRWAEERIDKWNALVGEISSMHKKKLSLMAFVKREAKTIAACVLFMVVFAAPLLSYMGYRLTQERKRADDLLAFYSAETPPSQRVNYLVSMYKDGASFDGANISSLDLSQLELSSINLRRGILISTVLQRADLSKANLDKALLWEADLRGAKLEGAILKGANLTKARLESALLGNADLTDANLAHADLFDANLVGADLTGVDLTEADLRDVKLNDANLTGANLTRVILARADLTNVRYSMIKTIKGANIYGVVNAPDGFIEWAIENGAVIFEDEAK